MTNHSLLRVMATVLVFMAACKSDFSAGINGNGGPKDGSAQEGGTDGPATCRAPSPDYGPTSTFSVLPNGTPAAATTCSAACGDSAWPKGLSSFPNIDIALPYGSCAPGTPSCSTGASVPCACGLGGGPSHNFNCSCEGGTWICRILVMGTAVCMCPDSGADKADQAPTTDGGPNLDGVSTGPAKPDGINLAGLTALTVTTTGGMVGPSPGDACGFAGTNVYSLDLQTRVLSWEHCAIDPSTANAYRKTETQLLTDYEVTAARLLLDLLSTDYNRTACGDDKALETLDLVFADRVEKYQDDFYAGCPSYAPVDGRTYLHYMDLIERWLDELGQGSNQLPSSFISLAVVSDLDPFPSSAAMAAATAACGAAVNPSYDVTAATKEIGWSSCVSGSTGYKLQTGNRVLSDSEFARVMQSWSAIQLGATGDCSTPRSLKSLQLTTAPDVYWYLYLNDFAACSRDTASAYSMYVVGLDDLAALLASLANGSSPSDAGVSDSGPAKPDGLNLAGLTALTVTSDPLTYGTYPPLCPLTGTSRKDTFSLDLGTRVFNWDYCSFDFNTSSAYQAQAARQLTDLDLTAVRLMLEQLSTNYDRTSCGIDKEIETLDLTFGDRIEKYQDDFYACPTRVPADGRTYLHYMDGIVWWLRNLSWLTEFPRTFTDIVVGVPYPSKTASAAAVADATAACGDTDTKYTLTSTTRELAWSSCVSPNGLTGHKLQTGTRILSDSEFALVLQSWSQIQLGATGDCSTPRPTESLHVTTASEMLSDFANDFTACNRPDDSSPGTATYVVGLDDFTALLASLAK